MSTSVGKRPYIDFQEVKEKVSLPDVLKVFGISDQFREQNGVLTGVCPLPKHQHGPCPNSEQFKMTQKEGVWCFYCHGDCKRGGDVIEFVKAMTGYENAHVRFWFAQHFGERLTNRSRGGPVKNGERTAPNEEACGTVQASPQAQAKDNLCSKIPSSLEPLKPLRFKLRLQQEGVPYLEQRGVRIETIRRFGIGVCKRGMLKGYIAIPIFPHPHEPQDNPVAYIGRWPGDDFEPDDGRPRYKLPPDFPKSRILYGLTQALESTTHDEPLIVVEGCFGVFHLVQNGFAATVATLGSSLSDEQAALLIRTGRPVILIYDGNEAGQLGMRQAAAKLITKTFIRVVKLDEDKQPDDLNGNELGDLLGFLNRDDRLPR